ncbi:G-type lectin S-receptor-like serine/threonine-protein kinase SD2-5 [Selaginella moellendorffii]|uniref:G-type lectin S-receptor-like serine/threonine-protein kinase SD2-5 n=1 Tax=Selaginella moellendorffii TaxID=88036 RepID=UPI000D1CD9D8|nr:G-type lectin S-receptor-like serine/threonine-protein kinase SD2-5 [Selaginella moellendorffii]|eukprot:XP_024521613.1 G-type lectin S-receptor-like serine/threonine-protein kinase SD2-5 [Selaginella moellendorffii]
MPNQKLVTGQSVVSNKNASDPSEGSYIAEIQASGSVGYMSIGSKKKQPYMLWSFVGSQIGSPSVTCPGFRTALSFTPAGEMSMVYEPIRVGGNEQPCGSPLSGEIFPGNTTMRYFQLADDGTMVSYRRELANGSWELDSTSQFFPPPAPCGSYGLLEKGKQCQCLTNEANNSTTSALGSCAQPEWSSLANCSSRYETDFVTLAGASYFANTFNPPDRTGAAMQDCLEQCKSTCSCAAFFFDQALQNCFFIEDVLGSLTVDSNKTQQLFGFLKYQNYSRLVPVDNSSSDTPKLLVIGITSAGAAVAIVTFALLFTILHRRRVMLDELNSFLTGVQASPYRFSFSSLYSATKGFTKVLGSGGCGTVYEGMLHNGMKLAVKKLSTQHGQKEFVTEVSALGNISHINIVKLYGFCADASHRLLVYELMPNARTNSPGIARLVGMQTWLQPNKISAKKSLSCQAQVLGIKNNNPFAHGQKVTQTPSVSHARVRNSCASTSRPLLFLLQL